MSDDLKWIAVAGVEQPFALWDVSDLVRPVPLAAPPKGPAQPHFLAAGPDEDTIICVNQASGELVTWNYRTAARRVVARSTKNISKFAASADGTAVATRGEDNVVRVHDVRNGQQLLQIPTEFPFARGRRRATRRPQTTTHA